MTIYQQIAARISIKTFDLTESDGGFPNLGWVIANDILIAMGLTEYQRFQALSGLAGQVNRNLDQAIKYVEKSGVRIYRGNTQEGRGKLLEFITPDPEYKAAQQQDYNRMLRNMTRSISSTIRNVERRLPEYSKGQLISDSNRILEKQGQLLIQ